MAPAGVGVIRAPVRLDSASRTFTNGEIVVHALADATIEIQRGELLVVLGPSGSGKSTLLNLIGVMDRPTSGHVWFDSTDLADASDAQLTDFRRRYVGFVFQFYNLIPTLTARENVELAILTCCFAMSRPERWISSRPGRFCLYCWICVRVSTKPWSSSPTTMP